MKIIIFFLLILPLNLFAQSSMRRCTLLPVTDSVGGAIGYKVFERIENNLKKSNWCTYVSNSSLINVFSKYRENLARHLKQKAVLKTVAEKLKVGSVIKISLVNEINGVDAHIEIYGENGEDLFFNEKATLETDEIEVLGQTIENWLEVYSKMIPYDAKINGVLGDQITLDVGKGYPISVGQEFVVKRLTKMKKHPLLKKVVDWETEILGQGKVFNISDNQALGILKVYRGEKKISSGDWVRLEPLKIEEVNVKTDEEKELEEPGKLGILSVALFGATSSVDTSTPSGSIRMSGLTFGFDFRGEAWITRNYFGALEMAKSVGKLANASGTSTKSSINATNGVFKLTGGYKYLPIGFFYGPQIDVYAGYGSYSFDLDYSAADGFGKGSLYGLLMGVTANIPINRVYRFTVQADFIPFPKYEDGDDIYGNQKSASALDLEIGIKHQYTPRMTIDGSIETLSGKARFSSGLKEISYHDNFKIKAGASFNF
jgi:hypothetical protein